VLLANFGLKTGAAKQGSAVIYDRANSAQNAPAHRRELGLDKPLIMC
jgi:hypothetical protein